MTDKTVDPQVAMRELIDFSQKFAAGIPALQAASGVEVGCSEKEAVFRDDKITLYRYKPIAKPAGVTPLLISYALVNRPYMMDLQQDRSLIRRLLEQGLDIYLIDWGYPNGADRFLDLDDYINGFLHNCLQHVLDEHRIDAANVLGVCQGGTFSLCYTALNPERVKNLVTMVTPVDFRTPENLLSKWAQDMDVDAVVDSSGNVSGEMLNMAYVSLMPFRLMQQKYVSLRRHPQGSAPGRELHAHGEVDLRQPGPGRRRVPPVHAVVLPGEPAGEGHGRARRPQGRPEAASRSRC